MNAYAELVHQFKYDGKNFDDILMAHINIEDKAFCLKENHTEEDLEIFINKLAHIFYDNGYGIMELYGNIVFKDNSWYERREYDGSEWWEYKSIAQTKATVYEEIKNIEEMNSNEQL